jgi:TorA maturation chaperone TorD
MRDRHALLKARALQYDFFGKLFSFVEGEERFQGVEEILALLAEHPIDMESEAALKRMIRYLDERGWEGVSQEFDGIFYDLSSDPVPTTASFYEEERDDGRKRLMMVEYLLGSSYRRDTGRYSDLEDDIGFILPLMASLIRDEAAGDEKAQRLETEIFRNVLHPFVDEFLENVAMHEKAEFYRDVAFLMGSFLAFERSFLDLHRPEPSRKPLRKKEKKESISEAEAKRRLENKRKKGEARDTPCVIEVGGDVEDEV